MQSLIESFFKNFKSANILLECILDGTHVGYCVIHIPKTKRPDDGVSYKPIWHGECKYCNKPIQCNEFGMWELEKDKK